MKKTTICLVLILLLIAGCAPRADDGDTVVLASMYPLYVAAANITQGVGGVRLELLAPATAGCLHDYQMTTADRQKVDDADIILLNGLGMEGFLDKLLGGKTTVVTSEGYAAIAREDGHEDHDDHDHEEHDHGEYNEHVWTSPDGAIWQAICIRDGLCEADPANAQAYVDNAQAYIDALMDLQSNMHTSLAPYEGAKIAVLHDSLAYFAREFKLEVVAVLQEEPESQLSAGELNAAVEAIRAEGAVCIFSETQYKGSAAAATLGRETGLEVYDLDTAVTGELDNLNAYLEAMDYNTLAVALALGGVE